MNSLLTRITVPVCGATVLALLCGCASSGVKNPSGVPVTQMNADEKGFVQGTGMESQDLVMVTDKMARSILSIPQIANAQSPPKVICVPVDNNTRFPINQQIFLTRIRAQLNSKAMGKVQFLARNQMKTLEDERNLQRTGVVTSSSNPNEQAFMGADLALTGSLEGMSTRAKAGTGDYVLYDFHLIDVRTSAIVWEDMAEIKKQGLEDAAYR